MFNNSWDFTEILIFQYLSAFSFKITEIELKIIQNEINETKLNFA